MFSFKIAPESLLAKIIYSLDIKKMFKGTALYNYD